MQWLGRDGVFKKQNVRAGLVFLTGFAVGFFIVPPEILRNSTPVQVVREDSAEYEFINPLLFTVGAESELPEYQPLKDIITDYTGTAIAGKDIKDVSVYFRNLNSAQWISVNDDTTYSPSSMLKVVTLMAVMRAAEADPSVLKKHLMIVGDDTELVEKQQRYAVENPIRSGRTYPVSTLIDNLIIDSDNVANIALINMLGADRLDPIYEDLQLDPLGSGASYTAEEYSHVFRTLYNSTYLSRSVSEKVLNLLSRTKFDQGIVAGVPTDTVVSHKFGSHVVTPSEVELHDCSIIYYPDSPYFLCVMTRGSEFEPLETSIADISKLVWEYFDEHLAN